LGGKVDEEQHASHLLFYAGADGYADLNKVVMAAAVSITLLSILLSMSKPPG